MDEVQRAIEIRRFITEVSSVDGTGRRVPNSDGAVEVLACRGRDGE